MATSEDPGEMSQDAAFHQVLQCLQGQKQSSEKDIQYSLKLITCDPSSYTMDHPKVIVFNRKDKSITEERVNE